MTSNPRKPAFPTEGEDRGLGYDGMSYRDWLLGQVASGFCAVVDHEKLDDPTNADAFAHIAFQVVDALLRERQRRWV